MADYTESKSIQGSTYPLSALDGLPIGRMEPLITPEQLRSRILFGIPLISAVKDPVTGVRAHITNEQLQDLIEGAISRVELDVKIDVFPVQRKERHPFDSLHYRAFLYFRTDHAPVTSVDRATIEAANQQEIFVVPKEWIEVGNLLYGQINMIPLAIASPTTGGMSVGGVGGMTYIAHMASRGWIPAFWSITYTSGFPDGKLPRPLNDLIGVYAGLEVLGMLAATHQQTSSSLGIDGLSQSVGTPGPQLYAARIQELEQRKKELTGKIQALFGKKLICMDL